jgi:hypothetical protein
MNENAAQLPLLWDTTAEASAFDPEDWFAYCEAVTGRTRPILPALAIQTVIPAHMDLVVARYGAVIDDFSLAEHPFAVFEHERIPMVIGRSAKGSYAAGGLDEMIALGARHIIFLGGSGTISHDVQVDDLFVPTRALRDEGVSYHYIPPGRWAYPSARLTASLLAVSDGARRPVKLGPNWTITAHFRQAISRLRTFRAEGCLVVNNESAPAFAVGTARGVDVAALLDVGDTLADERFLVPAGHAKLYQHDDAMTQLDLALAALVHFHRSSP